MTIAEKPLERHPWSWDTITPLARGMIAACAGRVEMNREKRPDYLLRYEFMGTLEAAFPNQLTDKQRLITCREPLSINAGVVFYQLLGDAFNKPSERPKIEAAVLQLIMAGDFDDTKLIKGMYEEVMSEISSYDQTKKAPVLTTLTKLAMSNFVDQGSPEA